MGHASFFLHRIVEKEQFGTIPSDSALATEVETAESADLEVRALEISMETATGLFPICYSGFPSTIHSAINAGSL